MKKLKTWHKLLIAFGLVIILPGTVLAVDKAVSKDIFIPVDETITNNFFGAGDTIEINGNVDGDIIVAGSIITIRGDVGGNIIAAGQTIKIFGQVNGNILAAGMNINISGNTLQSVYAAGESINLKGEINQNAYLAGTSLTTEDTAKIGRGVHMAGAIIDLSAPIGADAWLGSPSISVNNQIDGNVTAYADDGQLNIAENGKISGDLQYRSKSEISPAEKNRIFGKVTLLEIPTSHKNYINLPFRYIGYGLGLGLIFSLLSALIVGLVIGGIFKNFTFKVAKNLTKKVGLSFGWGAIFFFAGPAAIFFCMITLIGIPLGLLLLTIYLVAIFLTTIYAGFTLGMLILTNFKKDADFTKKSFIGALFLGIFIFFIITKIPFLGWLIGIAGTIWALGGIILSISKKSE